MDTDLLVRQGFTAVGTLEAERDASGHLVVETPARAYANPHDLPLHAFGRGPFARLTRPTTVDPRPGLFAIVSRRGVLVVGTVPRSLAETFGERGLGRISAADCHEERQSRRCAIAGEIALALLRGERLELFFRPSAHPAEDERAAVAALQPAWRSPVATLVATPHRAGAAHDARARWNRPWSAEYGHLRRAV